MKRLLPGRVELSLFVVMAIVAGLLVGLSAHKDEMLFFVTMPVVFVSLLLGGRRRMLARQAAVKRSAESRSDATR